MEAAFLVGAVSEHRGAAPVGRLAAAPRLPQFDLRCARCGYGVVVRVAPERCPMCAGSAWEHSGRLGR